MKTLRIFALLATFAATSMAQEKLALQKDDTVASVLRRSAGQRVELRIKGGEKLAGKVEVVGENAVQLSALTGQEFYDAVVMISDISAVVVRTK